MISEITFGHDADYVVYHMQIDGVCGWNFAGQRRNSAFFVDEMGWKTLVVSVGRSRLSDDCVSCKGCWVEGIVRFHRYLSNRVHVYNFSFWCVGDGGAIQPRRGLIVDEENSELGCAGSNSGFVRD